MQQVALSIFRAWDWNFICQILHFILHPSRFTGMVFLLSCGVILAVVYAARRCSAFGIKQDDMYDCVLFAVPLGIVCARIYYVIFEWEQYKNDLSEVFAIWHGGLAIYGGILGGIALSVAAVCRVQEN